MTGRNLYDARSWTKGRCGRLYVVLKFIDGSYEGNAPVGYQTVE